MITTIERNLYFQRNPGLPPNERSNALTESAVTMEMEEASILQNVVFHSSRSRFFLCVMGGESQEV